MHIITCSSVLDSNGESAVTRFTAAVLSPGGATDWEVIAEDCSASAAVFDPEDNSVVAIGCLGVVLKTKWWKVSDETQIIQSFVKTQA